MTAFFSGHQETQEVRRRPTTPPPPYPGSGTNGRSRYVLLSLLASFYKFMQHFVPVAAHSVHLRDMIRGMVEQIIPAVIGTLALHGNRRASETTIEVVGPKTLVTGDPDLTK